MGVYNPFAELPNSCVLCDSREKCDLHREYAGRSVGRHKDCPLVEVKAPHGRLGDLDALKAEIIRTYEYEFPTATGAFDEFAIRIVPNIINNAPTVLEDEGKDNV